MKIQISKIIQHNLVRRGLLRRMILIYLFKGKILRFYLKSYKGPLEKFSKQYIAFVEKIIY